MTAAWDGPGDGWRQIDDMSTYGHVEVVMRRPPGAKRWDMWAKQPPLPTLPTEAWTVIRVTWGRGNDDTVMFLRDDGRWHDESGTRYLPTSITGYASFEVLSSPRVPAEDDDEYFDRAELDAAREEGVQAGIRNAAGWLRHRRFPLASDQLLRELGVKP